MRSFIAIELDQETKKKVLEIQNEFSQFPLTYPKKDYLHLTLTFMDNIHTENVNSIIQIIKSAARQTPCFYLKFSSLGAFPNLKLPKVVWIGLDGDLEILFNLEKRLNKPLKQQGFITETEKFIPHITFGRVKSFANKNIRKHLGEAIQRYGKIENVRIPCQYISFFKSIPTSAGYVHELLSRVSLMNEKLYAKI